MRRALMTILALLAATPAVAAPLAPGRYCAHDALTAGTDGPPLGNFDMVVDISTSGSGLRVSFFNAMPDSQQILEVDSAPATVGPDSALRFAFVDGWENHGVGVLTADGRITLRMVQRSPETNQIERNYVSDYPLSAAACRQRDREIRFTH